MASLVVGIWKSIHLACRPILKKIEVNSFFGCINLRIGSLIVAVIQLCLAGGSSYEKRYFLGACYFIMAILLIIGAALDQKYLAVPWLLLTFCFEGILIGFMIYDLLRADTHGYQIFFKDFFSFIFHLIGFSVVYSYYMQSFHERPTINNHV